jgi:hypothetical protein
MRRLLAAPARVAAPTVVARGIASYLLVLAVGALLGGIV